MTDGLPSIQILYELIIGPIDPRKNRDQPELLQDQVTAQGVFQAARRFYREPGYREQVVSGLQEAVGRLGEPGAAERVAGRILAAAKEYGRTGDA